MPRKQSRKRPAVRSRRARGTGSVFWSAARGVWVGRVAVGKKPDGGVRYAERSDASQERLVEKLRLCRPPGPETTVAEFATRWLEGMTCRKNTRGVRENAMARHVLPAVGGERLADLTPAHVERAAAGWVLDGMGPSTARVVVGALQTCLKEAVRAGIVPTNAAALARKPRAPRRHIDPFAPAELRALVAGASARASTRVWALVAATGMRSGEAFALDCADFDAATGLLSISRTYGQRGGMGPPKSPHSVRTIRVPAAALAACAAARGDRSRGPLFVTERGERYVLPVARANWDRLLARLDLKPRTPHQTRHAVATHLLAAGQQLADVARFLGDSVGSIVRTYVHATQADPADALDGLLGTGS
jgi:integrase